MRLLRCALLSVFIVMIFSSCDTDGYNDRYIEPINPNSDPEIIEMTNDMYEQMFAFDMDTDYSQISVEIEYPMYSLDTECIRTTIKNNNVAKGFRYYAFPLLEYKYNDEWVRLSYYPYDYYIEHAQWYICGIEENKTDCYSTIIFFYPEYVQEELISGQYRLVYFAGDKVLYQEFVFEE